MKPRIFLFRGIWHCKTAADSFLLVGIGYTPKQAYTDWMRNK